MKRTLIMLLSVALVVPVAFADPVKISEIPASAKWAMHVDNEAGRGSAFVKTIMDKVRDKQKTGTAEEKKGAAKILDLHEKLADLKSVTLFGPSEKESEAVLVIRARYDRAEVDQMIGLGKGAQGFRYGRYEIYPVKDREKGKTGLVCYYDKTTVIGGQDIIRIREVIDVLDNAKGAESLSGASGLGKILSPSKGSVLLAGVTDLAGLTPRMPKAGKGPQLIRKIRSVRVELGEDDGGDYFEMKAEMASEEDATQVKAILQGFIAVFNLMKDENTPKEISDLVKSFNIISEGNVLTTSIKIPTEDLIKMLENFDRMKKIRGGKRGRKHLHTVQAF